MSSAPLNNMPLCHQIRRLTEDNESLEARCSKLQRQVDNIQSENDTLNNRIKFLQVKA